MKKIIQFCAALAVALGVAGCYNDFDMPAPRPAATDADFADMERISIADVKQLFLDEHKSISDTGSNSSWNDTKYTLIGQSESGKDYYIKVGAVERRRRATSTSRCTWSMRRAPSR